MRLIHNVQRHTSARRCRWGSVGISLLVCALLFPARMQAQAPTPTPERELSNAFRRVAQQAVPAVVFITVETAVATQRPMPFNQPFDWFGEDFMERFFGRRSPEGRKQQSGDLMQQGAGSGFIISQDGLILTNYHVIGDADDVMVKLTDGREFSAKTIGTDPPSDVALLKVEAQGLPVLPLGDSDAIEVGDWAVAAGSPFGLTQTITVGVVSAKGRNRLGLADFEDFMQTDAAINPGNSGGPLLNMQGEVIGVNTAIASHSGGYMGIGFAIPSNMVQAIKEQLVTRGKVIRGYLGVSIQPLTSALAQSLHLDDTEGVLVADVAPGSPAEKAGLKRGDVIVSFNGHPVHDPGQLQNLAALTAPGTTVTVQILRKNQEREVSVELGELPQQPTAARGSEEMQAPSRLGFSVQNLTPELAQQLGVEGTTGVVVTQVDPNSEAYQAGVRRGMVIHEVNQQEVKHTQDFWEAVEKREQSEQILLLVQGPQATMYLTFPVG